jgi:plastocyanin
MSMRNAIRDIAVGTALVLIVVCGVPGAAAPAASEPTDNLFASKKSAKKKRARARFRKTVRLKDNFFAPSTKSVVRGTTVRFKWTGINAHNVVKASGPGGRFASRTTWRRGVNFAKKFRKTGTYRLICTLHSGMELKLKVVPRRKSARRPSRRSGPTV